MKATFASDIRNFISCLFVKFVLYTETALLGNGAVSIFLYVSYCYASSAGNRPKSLASIISVTFSKSSGRLANLTLSASTTRRLPL